MTDAKESAATDVVQENDTSEKTESAEEVKSEIVDVEGDKTSIADGKTAEVVGGKEEIGELNSCADQTETTCEMTSDDPNAWRPHEDENSSLAKAAPASDGDGDVAKANKEGGEEPTEKKRTYNRKVVRIPKEVFDFMARIEEDGVVRFNLTQLGVFYLNELKFMGTNVDALEWDKADVPLLNVGIPPTAKDDLTLIVDHFSSDPEIREAQETRLKGILENREKLREIYASGGKILPADGVDRKVAKRQRKKERREERKKLMEAEQGIGKNAGDGKGNDLRKKRSAENTDSSTTLEGGVAAKQPRLDANDAKTFPKKNGGPQSGAQSSKQQTGSKQGGARNVLPKKRTLPPHRRAPNFNEWHSGPANFFGGVGRDRFRQKPRPFPDTRPREIPSLFPPRNGPSKVSPWSRPPYQEDMHKLEQVMRRAAHDNSSSFDAVRQVERLGLGSAMGAMLNSVTDRDMPMNPYIDAPRQMPSLVEPGFSRRRDEPFSGPRYGDEPFGASRYSSGRDAPVRDITGFVEPLDEFTDSSRKPGYNASSHVERITYPTIGGGPVGRGNAPVAPFGQSFPAFSDESYRQRIDFGGGGRPRSVSPYGRTFYR